MGFKMALILCFAVVLMASAVSAASAAGEYLGEVCIALSVPSTSNSLSPVKLSVTSLGTNYFQVAGLSKWSNPPDGSPVYGVANMTTTNITISLNTSDFNMPTGTFTIFLNPKDGKGAFSAVMLLKGQSAASALPSDTPFITSVVDGYASIIPCSQY